MTTFKKPNAAEETRLVLTIDTINQFRKISDEFPIGCMTAFLALMQRPDLGITGSELVDVTGMEYHKAMRSLKRLTIHAGKELKAFDLVSERQDVANVKALRFFLNDKGHALARSVMKDMRRGIKTEAGI
ncbi:hypothetical protein [Vibrio panuliri]|uniref:MarR family transcriptional regulator n=1 Tax=Vibrio panuliri TaxID=1381081 RepID=A0ABX3FIA2_9VIBR|nr:hypothetical protein [Vibrio panuliri]KAB1460859.1 hypothetical protein F7O85_00345 [Vibrio panuliri]OLQ91665.1 hypothetical protein BIY20_09690 [Vibrio panuliri]